MGEPDHGREFKDKLEQEIHERIHRDVHDEINQNVTRPKVMMLGDVHWGFVWGLLITLVGTALLLYHLGIIPFDPIARYWPLLFVLLGIMNLMRRSGRFFGFLLILAGLFLQVNKLGIIHLTFADVWPIALIAVGLLLMWGSLEARGFINAKKRIIEGFRQTVAGASDAPAGVLNAVAIFGGCERRISSKNVRGGKATAVLGGIELDFRDADIDSENGEAILEINCILGGVEIRVPENWHVHSRSVPVLGGYEDTSRQTVDATGAKPRTLVITGMVVLGGVEIRN